MCVYRLKRRKTSFTCYIYIYIYIRGGALDVSTDRFNMWQKRVASAILAIAEDELRSGSSARYYKYLCSSWQLPVTHVPLTAEIANYIRETSTKRSILAERANAYSTGHTKNLFHTFPYAVGLWSRSLHV